MKLKLTLLILLVILLLGTTWGIALASEPQDSNPLPIDGPTSGLQGKPFTPMYTTQAITDGLIACYAFSGNANDSSGNNNHGTVQGAILTTDRFGHTNRAYQFDGINDYIRVPHSDSLNINESISLVAWVKFEAGGAFSPRVLHKEKAYELFTGNTAASRPIIFGLNASSGTPHIYLNSITTYDAGNWMFLVGTYDGSQVKLYNNGGLVIQQAYSSTIFSSSSHLEIGRNGFNGNDDYKGIIDDVRIYNRALSEQEILELYQRSDKQNCDNQGSLTIKNKTMPEDSSGFTFTSDFGAFSLADKESYTIPELSAGSYTILENKGSLPNQFWGLLSVQCEGHGGTGPVSFSPQILESTPHFSVTIPVATDQALTCTFTNQQTRMIYLPIILSGTSPNLE
ncbi:MAG: LamG domain-containing protein [Chloroflexota bacterium]